eukprot:4685836-Pyramimonas_sp.AAC.1
MVDLPPPCMCANSRRVGATVVPFSDWCPVRVYALSPSMIGACRLAWQVSVLVSARDAICSGDRDFLVAKDGLGV